MPTRRYRLGNLFVRLVLLSLAAVSLAVLRPGTSGGVHGQRTLKAKRRSGLRRAAVSLSFATLFFSGAAFSAGAGDLMVGLVEKQASTAGDISVAEPMSEEDVCDARWRSEWEEGECPKGEAATTEARVAETASETSTEASPSDTAAAASEAPSPETASPETASPSTAAAIAAAAQGLAAAGGGGQANGANRDSAALSLSGAVRLRAKRSLHDDGALPVLRPRKTLGKHAVTADPEVDLPGMSPTIWLHRALPDPTPPSKRLTASFARDLRFASSRHRVDWALMLGVLRARGERGSEPARKVGLNRLARNLVRLGARGDQWNALLALEGRTAFADRALALTRYHRAVGLRALVRGLESAKPRLAKKLLADLRVSMYPGGRQDVESGKTDVRVIVLIQYLAEAHGQVTVSSLTSGHGVYSRPGVVSAHTYGQAVDIAALEGKSITGNQAPGGLTEMAVRNLLLLPAELRPNQLISLLGLGGPSFPMGNHDDHIHAGF